MGSIGDQFALSQEICRVRDSFLFSVTGVLGLFFILRTGFLCSRSPINASFSFLYSQQGVNYNDAINCYPCRDGSLIARIGLKDLICSFSLTQSCQHMQD